MIVVIDTNSLLSLVRYYLPFDKDGTLFNFLKNKISNNDIIIIDKVLNECEYVSKGIVMKSLTYLNDKAFKKSYGLPYRTDFILAPSPAKFLRQVDNQFVYGVVKNKLSPVEYENRKNVFMNSADMKLILYCLNFQKDNLDEDIFIVTEETEESNDSKAFKKIPAICKMIGIKTLTLPQLLQKYENIEINFN